ncbi:hypothetical protein [Klebsiella phage phiKp_21]|nr:hypothetical protein [Klebsiella phage phiKp_21]
MSIYRIRGDSGVIIDSTNGFLELPKALLKNPPNDIKRPGMIRYNSEWEAFEGTLQLLDDTVEYRRFVQLDANGKISIANLPDTLLNGMAYKGTFNPNTDDVDPPSEISVYDNLPPTDSTNSGHYYVTRGIVDIATTHMSTTNPSTSPVIFTPTNPSGEGDWLEIKYYFTTDGNGSKSVTSAYARFNVDQIPTTGHEGLISLTSDPDLTEQFEVGNASYDPGLRDSDWIISTGTKWQSLRQYATRIAATSVTFDNKLVNSYGRQFPTSVSDVQSVLDLYGLDCLRRTGDAMYDDGISEAEGRFAATYGTVDKPAITFNNKTYDPTENPGIDPSKWSDSSTGLYHRGSVTGEFSATASSKEVQRWKNTEILFFPQNPTVDGYNGETKLTEIGFRPPFIDASNNTLGENGMLAFSPSFNTLIQKISGKWKRISGSETINISDMSSWVPSSDGINYELVITVDEPKSVQVQELMSNGFYENVAVENMSIELDKVKLQVPMEPDMRFLGRCVVGV